MALVKGGRYYQQSVRVNGRVTTRYLGKDAAIFAEMDKLTAAENQPERDRLKAYNEEQDRLYLEERERGANAQAVVAIGLEGLGFVRENFRPWRRKPVSAALPVRLPKRGDPQIRQQMRTLVESVFRDEAGALDKLRKLSKSHPQEFATEVQMDLFDMLFDFTAGLAFKAESGNPEHDKKRLDLEARMRLMAVELAGEDPSEASRLCAMAGAFAWADFCCVSIGAVYGGLQQCGHPKSVLRRNAAHRRLMTSLKTLAQIKAAEARQQRMVVKVAPKPAAPKKGESIFDRFAGKGIADFFPQIGANK